MVLTPRIVEAVKIPVLASGGIVDGRGFAAALALGAEGVELGTRFVAVQESNAHPNYQQALVEAQETDTVIIERSIGRPARVLDGLVARNILHLEASVEQESLSREQRLSRLLPAISGSVNKQAALNGQLNEGFVWAGQAAGLIHDIPTARDLIEQMVTEAHEIAQRLGTAFQDS
jgi:enoyl-[acyl-carrier protein] reductase II